MKKLLIAILILIATPVSAKMLWEYGDFNERAEMAVYNGIVSDVSEYKGTYKQNIELLNILENPYNLGASVQPAALSTYSLAGSGVNSSATSITLQSLTLPQNDFKIQDSNLSDTFYITLEPGSKVRQEIVSCTTVTQNSGGTATLSGCVRGLSPVYPYTASSSLQFSHAGGSQVIFSDPPQLFNLYPAKANDETITGKFTFNIYPENGTGVYATTSNQFITLAQGNAIGNQGAATATPENAGIVEEATRDEIANGTSFDANNPHYISSKYATTSPDVATSSVVVSESDGKINHGWLDLTENFDFSGINTFSEISSASTTLSGTNVLNTYPTASTSIATKGYVDEKDSSYYTYFNISGSITSIEFGSTIGTTTAIKIADNINLNSKNKTSIKISGDVDGGTETLKIYLGNGIASTTIYTLTQTSGYHDPFVDVEIYEATASSQLIRIKSYYNSTQVYSETTTSFDPTKPLYIFCTGYASAYGSGRTLTIQYLMNELTKY